MLRSDIIGTEDLMCEAQSQSKSNLFINSCTESVTNPKCIISEHNHTLFQYVLCSSLQAF